MCSHVENTGKPYTKQDKGQGQFARAAGEQGADEHSFCNVRQRFGKKFTLRIIHQLCSMRDCVIESQ